MKKTPTSIRIRVTEDDREVSELVFETKSGKRLKESEVARLLAIAVPGFRRRTGRLSLHSGMETLPAVEKSGRKWVAWRLRNEDDTPSGYEPPLPGEAAAEVSENPFSDRTRGVWQRAEISES